MATSGSSGSPYTFAATSGYRNDGDAGLTHVGARYYDAQVGRFITRDTLLDQHPYLYCDHDPVNALDPSGHCRAWDWACGAAHCVVGAVARGGRVVSGAVGGVGRWIGGAVTSGWEFAKSWFDWGGSDLLGEVGKGAEFGSGPGAVVGPIGEGVGAIVEIHEAYKKRECFENMPTNTLGGANGCTRAGQDFMVRKWSDPDTR